MDAAASHEITAVLEKAKVIADNIEKVAIIQVRMAKTSRALIEQLEGALELVTELEEVAQGDLN